MNLTITITRHSACRKGKFCAVERIVVAIDFTDQQLERNSL